MKHIQSVLKGTGHYLPNNVIDNSYFEQFIETSDEWIRTRTGIRQRHFVKDGETTSAMAATAAQRALANSGYSAKDIDLLILATSTPDLTFPATATQVHAKLGMRNGFAFDIQAVCAGFVFALSNANALLRTGEAERALVIGAETFSKILDWSDRSTCILFGDGAGAVVLEAEECESDVPNRGILSTDMHSDGQYMDLLYVDGGVSTTKTAGHVRMKGKEVYRHAVSKLVDCTKSALRKANLKCSDVDWVVPHQANIRIINAVTARLGLSEDRTIVTLENQGNTSAASIPLAISIANDQNIFKQGDIIVSQAIGGGLSWGAFVLKW